MSSRGDSSGDIEEGESNRNLHSARMSIECHIIATKFMCKSKFASLQDTHNTHRCRV